MLNKKTITGMRDILPKEMELRNYVLNVIRKTYKEFGFLEIETPCMENIENLTSKQGGDNEKLIFKTLKRGEKLDIINAQTEQDIVDYGLRYDLTLPLSRYYANNCNDLPNPFKTLQIGNVWRADRPQKGRYRQFMQCDIDILGDSSNLAEIELILATSSVLTKLNFDFNIRINDRRILKAMILYAGFEENAFEDICITLDKMDKIGLEGVKNELLSKGYDLNCCEKYLNFFEKIEKTTNKIDYLNNILKDYIDLEVLDSFKEIVDTITELKEKNYNIILDPTLVRGMSYYTGTIYEISIPEFSGSCGGGGRYDKMIGKFIGKDTPACGFSIGFERIIMLLLEKKFQIPTENKKIAYLIEKNMQKNKYCEIIKEAKKERILGNTVLIVNINKNKKFQKEQLINQGYTEIKEFYNNQ